MAGVPLAGGRIYTFAAQSSTPLATFTDSSGLTPNTNPILLDSAGRAAIWVQTDIGYKFSVHNNVDALQYTEDNILIAGTTTASLDDYSTNVAQMQIVTNPGDVGSESLATSLSGELERLRFEDEDHFGKYWYGAGRLWVNVKSPRYGATGNGTTPEDAAISLALTEAVAKGAALLFPPGTYLLTTDVTLPVQPWFVPGSLVKMAPGKNLTLTKPPLAGNYQIWDANGSTTGTIRLANCAYTCNVMHWGAVPWFHPTNAPSAGAITTTRQAIQAAITAAVSNDYGTAVFFPNGQYYVDQALQLHNGYTVSGKTITLMGDGPLASVLRVTNAATNDILHLDVYGAPTRITNLGFAAQFGGNGSVTGIKTVTISPGTGVTNGLFLDHVWISGTNVGAELLGTSMWLSNLFAGQCATANLILDGAEIHLENFEIEGGSGVGLQLKDTLANNGLTQITNGAIYSTATTGIQVSNKSHVQVGNVEIMDGVACMICTGICDDVQIVGGRMHNPSQFGFYTNETVTNLHMHGVHVSQVGTGSTGIGIVLSALTSRALVTGNTIDTTRRSAMTSAGNAVTISGNVLAGYGAAGLAGDQYGVLLSSGAGTVQNVQGNVFSSPTRQGIGFQGAAAGAFLVTGNTITGGANLIDPANAPAGTRIRNNVGWVTESSGTATITSAATSVVVNHGLSVTPPAAAIQVTPTNDPTADIVNYWVDTITSTQFTLRVAVAPGVSTATFAWQASVLST